MSKVIFLILAISSAVSADTVLISTDTYAVLKKNLESTSDYYVRPYGTKNITINMRKGSEYLPVGLISGMSGPSDIQGTIQDLKSSTEGIVLDCRGKNYRTVCFDNSKNFIPEDLCVSFLDTRNVKFFVSVPQGEFDSFLKATRKIAAEIGQPQ